MEEEETSFASVPSTKGKMWEMSCSGNARMWEQEGPDVDIGKCSFSPAFWPEATDCSRREGKQRFVR